MQLIELIFFIDDDESDLGHDATWRLPATRRFRTSWPQPTLLVSVEFLREVRVDLPCLQINRHLSMFHRKASVADGLKTDL